MQVVLVMFRPDGERRSFSLPRSVTVIGRREDCDLRIPLGDVSRKHCRFIADDESLRIEDLGSSNGTYHNGVRIQEATVQPGDSVQIGPVSFVVQIDGIPLDDEIQAPAPPSVASAMNSDDTGVEMPGAAAEGAEITTSEGPNANAGTGAPEAPDFAAAESGNASGGEDDLAPPDLSAGSGVFAGTPDQQDGDDLIDLAMEELKENKPEDKKRKA